jgi:hypothetical protein
VRGFSRAGGFAIASSDCFNSPFSIQPCCVALVQNRGITTKIIAKSMEGNENEDGDQLCLRDDSEKICRRMETICTVSRLPSSLEENEALSSLLKMTTGL